MKDMGYVNMFSDGHAVTPFPQGTSIQVSFYVDGMDAPLHRQTFSSDDGLFALNFDARQLRTGARLVVGLALNGGSEGRLSMPRLDLLDDDRLGFNLLRRIDGSMMAEVFLDRFDANGAETPDGLSDNGVRLVVDNGTDVNNDGIADSVARMDSSDGLCFFDINMDGYFGDASADGLAFYDLDENGAMESVMMATDEASREAGYQSEMLAYMYDPDLDGVVNDEGERDASAQTFNDLIDSLTLNLSTETLPANGINTLTMSLRVRGSSLGLPLKGAIDFGLALENASAVEGLGARYLSNGLATDTRELTPNDRSVRLLSNGDFLLTQSVVMPVVLEENLSEDSKLRVFAEVRGRSTGEVLRAEGEISLTPSQSPVLEEVLISGQYDISSASGGLDAVSRLARLVAGDAVRVNGRNFANSTEGMIVTLGGVPVDNLSVDSAGTQIDFTVPVGAESGAIAVVVGGEGGMTSEELVVSGIDLEPTMISPAPTLAQQPTNVAFSMQMSRAVDPATLNASSVFIRAQGGSSLNWDVSLNGDATIQLSRGSGAAMTSGNSYELVMSSDLAALDDGHQRQPASLRRRPQRPFCQRWQCRNPRAGEF